MILKLNKKQNESNLDVLGTEKIRGLIKYVFYPKQGLKKDSDATFVGITIIRPGGEKLKCFGLSQYIEQGDYFEFEGHFQEDGTFKFSFMKRVDDDEVGAISMLKFLFGAKTAMLIQDNMGGAVDAMNCFKSNFDYFQMEALKIKGIGCKKLEKAYNKYQNNIAVDILYQKFSKYKMSMNQAVKIFKKWGAKSLEVIEKNPYILYTIENCCYWDTVDNIALKHYKLDSTDERRMSAGVLVEMNASCSNGDDFAYYKDIVKKAAYRLKVDVSYVQEAILLMIDKKTLILVQDKGTDILYLPYMYKAEVKVADLCKKFITNRAPTDNQLRKINEFINDYENNKGFKLAQKQREAIINSLTNKLSIISGPPGSGKTTIIDVICNYYAKEHILLAAPSAKAADRMYKSTGLHSSTVHRLLKYMPQENTFTYNTTNPLPASVVIVDEVSMLGLVLTSHLLEAVPENVKALIFVGDVDQLPSVDAGNILSDMLNGGVPSVILDEIYRQGDGSVALTRAMEFKNRKGLNTTDSNDFKFYEESNINTIQEGVVELFLDDVNTYGLDNVCILTPQNKGELGVNKLNEIIQERFNPKVFEKTPEIKSGNRKFRVGDRVLHTVNEDDRGVYNGYVGTIIDIIEGDKNFDTVDTIIVQYDDIEETYTRERFDNIKLAYALTVHKSQGSEYKSVIMIAHSSHSYMLNVPLIYTGMTRVKNILHIIGEKKALDNASKAIPKIRNSRLKELLID